MAFTAANRADIRFYMGWSARFFQSDSRLEQAMNGIDTEPEAEALILAAVVECKDVDVKLKDAHNRLKAMKVGSIDLPGKREIETLRGEGKRHVTRMSSTLGVEARIDVYDDVLPRTGSGHGGTLGGGNYGLHG